MIKLPVKMSQAKESSEPFFIELYVVKLRTETLFIAACDENIVFAGQQYIAVPFSRGEITRSIDNITDEVKVQLADCSDELLSYVLNGFDFRGCVASIFRIMYPDSLSNNDLVSPVFIGTLDEPSFSGGVFTCKIVSHFPDVNTPVRTYSSLCNCEFGDAICGMSTAATTCKVTRQTGVNASQNAIVLSKTFPDNYWKDGYIVIGGEARAILKSYSNVILVSLNFLQDIDQKSAALYRGCDKTTDMCHNTYNNMTHFSGFPAIPFECIYR